MQIYNTVIYESKIFEGGHYAFHRPIHNGSSDKVKISYVWELLQTPQEKSTWMSRPDWVKPGQVLG